MKNLIKNSIITQAILLGFDFEQFTPFTDLQEVEQAMVEFFNENADKLERLESECEVATNGRTQDVSYGDFSSHGEIVNYSSNWAKSPDTKIFHSYFVVEDDGLMKKIHLYCLVGETDYNAPDGYYYSEKLKKHVKI